MAAVARQQALELTEVELKGMMLRAGSAWALAWLNEIPWRPRETVNGAQKLVPMPLLSEDQ